MSNSAYHLYLCAHSCASKVNGYVKGHLITKGKQVFELIQSMHMVMCQGRKITFRPMQNVCNWDPHCLATLASERCREATAATSEESSPPDRSTPNGTSVISLLSTAYIDTTNKQKVKDWKESWREDELFSSQLYKINPHITRLPA